MKWLQNYAIYKNGYIWDKSSLYEVQISGLKLKLEKLENEIKEIKTKIA